MPKIVDLTGQRFGMISVAKKLVEKDNNGKTQYLCYCDCDPEQKHGFIVRGTNLTNGKTTSCGCKKSTGEHAITQCLLLHNIPFLREYKFDDLKDKERLRYDFAVLTSTGEVSHLIEFDGEQHYDETVEYNWINKTVFQGIKHRDAMKNEYCKRHGIPLIRIPFRERDRITLELLDLKTSPYILR